MEYCSLGDLSIFIRRKGQVQIQEQLSPDSASLGIGYTSKPLPGPWGGIHEKIVRHFLVQLGFDFNALL